MKYLALLILLTACGPARYYSPQQVQLDPYNPYIYSPTCHAPVVGGICTGPAF